MGKWRMNDRVHPDVSAPAIRNHSAGEWEESLDQSEGLKRRERLFLTAYLLWMTGALLGITMWRDYTVLDFFRGYLQRVGYLLLFVEFFSRARYAKRDVCGVFLIIFISAIAKHTIYNTYIIPSMVFVYFSADVRLEKILKSTLIFHAVFMAVTVAASQMGIIEDVIWYEGARVRHSLGYEYCGYPAHLLLFLTLLWFCLRKKTRVVEAVLFLVLHDLMYLATDSRTDFYLGVLAIAGFFVWTREFRWSWARFLRDALVKAGFLFIMVFSIAAHLFYDSSQGWMAKLNYALNNRLQFGLDAIRTYGFSLFGREIRWVGQGTLSADASSVYNYVDCSYLKDLQSFGVLFMLLLVLGFYLAGRWVVRRKAYGLGWAMLLSFAYAVLNAHLCVLTFNPFLFLLGRCFPRQICLEDDRRETRIGNRESQRIGLHSVLIPLKRPMLLLALLGSGFCAFLVSRETGEVYDFTYGQRTALLRDQEYDAGAGTYTVTGENAFFNLKVETPDDVMWNYLCVELDLEDKASSRWRLTCLDRNGRWLGAQDLSLADGKNNIAIEYAEIGRILLAVKEEEGFSYSIRNIQLREQGTVLRSATFLGTALALLLAFCCLLMAKQLLFEKGIGHTLLNHMEEGAGRWIAMLGAVLSGKEGMAVLGKRTPLTSAKKGNEMGRISAKCRTKRRAARTAVLFLLISYVIYGQIRGDGYMVRYSGMHLWVEAGLLLVLTGLCSEGADTSPKDPVQSENREKRHRRGGDSHFVVWIAAFLALTCLSDLVVNKWFRDAGLVLFLFGGLLCKSWRRMESPGELMEEFCWACRGSFFVSLLFCLFFRPAMPGLCYSGPFTDAAAFGIFTVSMLAVFLSGMRDKKTWFLDGILSCLALYLCWTTQQLSIVLAASVVSLGYVIFWFQIWIGEEKKERVADLCKIAGILVAGLPAVFLIRQMLYHLPLVLGTQVVYAGDRAQLLEKPLVSTLMQEGWEPFFLNRFLVCKTYLRSSNLLGHFYRESFHGISQWPANSIVMNLYRYGVMAGVVYGGMLLASAAEAYRYCRREKDYLPLGIVLAYVSIGMLEAVELPFVQFSWLLFYAAVGWMIATRRET